MTSFASYPTLRDGGGILTGRCAALPSTAAGREMSVSIDALSRRSGAFRNVARGEGRRAGAYDGHRERRTALRLFTTLTTLGTPLDVTVQEIRAECFFPADPGTAHFFSEWAARGRE
jgi:hypothetical protein